MSMLSSFLHPGRAYKKAHAAAQNYYNQAQGFQQPYMQHGQEAYGNLSNAMSQLMSPEKLQDLWISNYQESPAARHAEELATQRGLNAASSMGLMGSTPALQALQGGASQIALEDRQNYLNDLMQKYLAGANIANSIYGQGAQSAGIMGQNAMNMGNTASQLAYGQQAAGGNLFGNLLGAAAGLAGSAVGGPIGGAIANKFIGTYQPWSTGGGR